MPSLNTSLDMVDDANDREHQGFLEVLLEANLLQEVGALIEAVIGGELCAHDRDESIQQQLQFSMCVKGTLNEGQLANL